jgi:hypothetical protein
MSVTHWIFICLKYLKCLYPLQCNSSFFSFRILSKCLLLQGGLNEFVIDLDILVILAAGRVLFPLGVILFIGIVIVVLQALLFVVRVLDAFAVVIVVNVRENLASGGTSLLLLHDLQLTILKV